MPVTAAVGLLSNAHRRTNLSSPNLSHVTDTARITAAARALETQRAFGWLSDPFAARLAGPGGIALARSLPGLDWLSFVIGMRTHIIDDLLLHAISRHQISTVINLGAGLDTRPWRLPLHSDLCWIEADLPPVLAHKHSVMKGEKPNCQLVSLSMDVNSTRACGVLFRKKFPSPALLLTEGLMMYLPVFTISAIIAEAQRSIHYWLLELTQSNPLQQIATLRPPDAHSGEQIARLLRDAGYVPDQTRNFAQYASESAPFGRLLELLNTPRPASFPITSTITSANGAHLFRLAG